MQIAATKPSSLTSIAKVCGFTEAKVQKYGQYFVEEVVSYASGKKDVQLDEFPTEEEAQEDLLALGLPDPVLKTLQLWRKSKTKDVSKLAADRGVKDSTVMSHLATALEKGAEISLEDFNITPAAIEALVMVIYKKPICSNVARLGPVRDEYELLHGKGQFDWTVAKMVVAMLKREHGCSEEGVLAWDVEDYGAYILPSRTKDRLQVFARQQPVASSPNIKEGPKSTVSRPSMSVLEEEKRSISSSSKERLQAFARKEGNAPISRETPTSQREDIPASSPYFGRAANPALSASTTYSTNSSTQARPGLSNAQPGPARLTTPTLGMSRPVVTNALKASNNGVLRPQVSKLLIPP